MSPLAKTAMVAGVLVLAACGAEPPPAPAPQAAPSPQAATPTMVAAPAAAPAAAAQESSEVTFEYDPKGLRDPFEPFVKLEVKKKEVPKAFIPKTPLQRYAVEEIRLVGVIWADGGKSVALVEDPEGKGYAVSGGAWIGDRGGRIVRIRPDGVDVEERFVDLFGEENVKVVSMALHKPEGEVSP